MRSNETRKGRGISMAQTYLDEPLLEVAGASPTRELEWYMTSPFARQNTRFGELYEKTARIPRADVIEMNDSFKVRIDLPGADKKDIRVKVRPNTIKVSAFSREEHELTEHEFYTKERSSEGYDRTIRLPDEIEGSTAKAKFHDGLLEIVVKKAKSALVKDVEVE